MAEPEAAKPPAVPEPTFRTYARDVASLTGKPLPKNAANVPAPAPTPTPAPKAPVPPPKPAEPPPAYIIPKAPTTNETRHEVLEHLRAQVEAPPVQPATPPVIVMPKAPSTNETQDEVLARIRAKAVSSPPPPAPVSLAAKAPVPTGPAPIHTYKSDFAAQVKDQGASRISIVAAEQDSGTTITPVLTVKKKRSLPLVIGGILLILVGIAIVYFAWRYIEGKSSVPPETFVPSLIFADERKELVGSGEELRQALALSEDSTSLPESGVMIAYLTYASTTEDGLIHIVANGSDLITALRLPAPDILLRNIEPESTVGVVHAGEETRPFFLLRVGSYERTFAGMLAWEATMQDDLAIFYPPFPTTLEATTTASSTLPASPTARIPFVDEVIDNRDVRVLFDASGRVLMLYGYRDKETLVIARDKPAFSELLKRLSATRAQ